MGTARLLPFLLLLISTTLSAANAERVFTIQANGELFTQKTASLFVLPNEEVDFKAPHEEQIICTADSGKLITFDPFSCNWRAPNKTGHYTVTLSSDSPQTHSMLFHVFVLIPFNHLQGEYLKGYRIGNYPTPSELEGHTDTYELPKGFIEVDHDNEDTLLSPHFSLKQFVCKEDAQYPKYIALKEKLILKLETILAHFNQGSNSQLSTFYVMSGYRTPYYNKAIENVSFSRHIFGEAADIFIPHGAESDYKRYGFGEISSLYNLVNSLELTPSFQWLIGGMGRYKATPSHPPFLHVDVRGRSARW